METKKDSVQLGFPDRLEDEPYLLQGAFAFANPEGLFVEREDGTALVATFEKVSDDILVVDKIVLTKEKAVATYRDQFKVIVNR